jgi:quercetin dioxygenase-like cupin family protein
MLMLRFATGAGLALIVLVATPAGVAAQSGDARPLALRATDPALKWGPCPPIFPGRCRIAVLHGDPAKPNADVFLQVPGGYELPAHTHSSAERMILVGGQLRVKYRGAPAATLSAGSYAYGPAGMPHRASCLGTAACTLFIAFEGPVDAKPFAGRVD